MSYLKLHTLNYTVTTTTTTTTNTILRRR